MVRVEVIRKRIQKLEEYLSILREMQKHALDAFLSTPMIGFRNVLVHDYVDVDHKIVYEALQNRLEDIEALKEVFATFL